MAEFPAMPLWTDAYLADTRHLSDAEHGRYLLLLIDMWRAPGRRFPNDKAWLARKFRRSLDAFESEIQPLLDEFCQCDGNWWTQKKLHKVWQASEKQRRKQADRAKSRWDKENTASHGNASAGIAAAALPALALPLKTQSLSYETQSLTELESLSPASKPSKAAPNGAGHSDRHTYQFDDWWACWDIPGTKKDRAAADRKYRATIKADAATHEELCAGVRRYMAWCRKERREVRYIKAPDVWLNKGCWADELGATGPPPPTQRRPFEDLSNYTAESYPPKPPSRGAT